MRYLIDSDWAIDFLNGRPAAVEFLQGLEPEGFGIGIVSYVELLDGVLGSRNIEQASSEFNRFLRVASVVDLSHGVADCTAQLRRSGAPADKSIIGCSISSSPPRPCTMGWSS